VPMPVSRRKRSVCVHISSVAADRLPTAEGYTVRLARHGKVHNLPWAWPEPESGSRLGTWATAWAASIGIVCSLVERKKGHSLDSKMYDVFVLGRFGKRLREIARGKLDMATLVQNSWTTAPQALTLTLELRGGFRGGEPVRLSMRVAVQEQQRWSDENESTASSTSSGSTSTLASGSIQTDSSTILASEQDLRGFRRPSDPRATSIDPFHPVLAPITSGRFPSTESLQPDEQGGAAAEGVVHLGDLPPGSLKTLPGEPPSALPAALNTELSRLPPTKPVASPGLGMGRPAAEDVRLEGWVRKRAVSAPTMLKTWRQRYLVLTRPSDATGTLCWYASNHAARPSGLIALSRGTCVEALPAEAEQATRKVRLRVGARELVFEAAAPSIEQWYQALCEVRDTAALAHADDPLRALRCTGSGRFALVSGPVGWDLIGWPALAAERFADEVTARARTKELWLCWLLLEVRRDGTTHEISCGGHGLSTPRIREHVRALVATAKPPLEHPTVGIVRAPTDAQREPGDGTTFNRLSLAWGGAPKRSRASGFQPSMGDDLVCGAMDVVRNL